MKHLDLFSGIGGFALAAKWLGIETVAFCEIEEFAQKVLKKNFPHIPIHNDVRNTDEFIQYRGEIDILTGGYPCQPFSVAGKQKAEEDPRHLWPAMFEIIKLVRPAWVLAENVAGHIKLGLDKVLADLESEGYSARAVVVPALAVNAPHERKRVWLIANASGSRKRWEGRKASYQGREASESGRESLRQGDGKELPICPSSANSDATNSPKVDDGKCEDRETQGQKREPGKDIVSTTSYTVSERGKRLREEQVYRKPNFSWCEDCRSVEDWRGLPDLLQPLLSGGSDGIPNRVDRTRGLGNAIVPQVAYEIMKAMLKL